MITQFMADDGEHSVTLLGDADNGFTQIVIEPRLSPDESISFFSEMSEAPLEVVIPEHLVREAASRGRRVCGYSPHCQTCFCDDEGNKTCVGIC